MNGSNPGIEVSLTAKAGHLVQGFNQAAMAVKNFAGMVNWAGGYVERALNKIQDGIVKLGKWSLGIGGSLTTAFTYATKKAIDFEVAMRNVNTVTGLGGQAFQRMGAQVLNLSTKLPLSATDLAEGMYQVASAGFQAADALTVIKAAGVAAVGGLTTTETAATALVGVLNAYNMSAAQSSYVSDVLFQTVQTGVINFEQLAQGMGEWVGLSSQLNLRISETSAALSAMTLNGLNANTVQTNLARTLEAFIRPSEDMTRVVHSLGYESATAMLQELGLHDSIKKLYEVTGGAAPELRKLFLETNALQGVLALGQGNFENYNRSVEEIDNRARVAGAAQRAMAENTKTLSGAIKLLKNNVDALSIRVGGYLTPILRHLVLFAADITQVFNKIPGPIIGAIAPLTAFVGLIMTVGGLLVMTKLKTLAFQGAFRVVSAIVGHEVMPPFTNFKGMLLWIAQQGLTGTANALQKLAFHFSNLGAKMTASVSNRLMANNVGGLGTAMVQRLQDAVARAGMALSSKMAQGTQTAMTQRLQVTGMRLSQAAMNAGDATAIGFMNRVQLGLAAGLSKLGMALGKPAGMLQGFSQRLRSTAASGAMLGGAVSAATVFVMGFAQAAENAKNRAREMNQELTKGLDPTDIQTVNEAINNLVGRQDDLIAKGSRNNDILTKTGAILQWVDVFHRNTIADTRIQGVETEKELTRLNKMRSIMISNVQKVKAETNLTDEAVYRLAQRLGVDLTDASSKVARKLIDAANAEGLTKNGLDELSDAAKETEDSFNNLGSALDGFTNASTILQDLTNDLNSNSEAAKTAEEKSFDLASARHDHEQALRDVTKAQRDLNREMARGIEYDKEMARLEQERADIALGDAIDKQFMAQDTLNNVLAGGGASGDAIRQATRDKKQADLDVIDAQQRKSDADQAMADANAGITTRQRQGDAAWALAEANHAVAQSIRDINDAVKASGETAGKTKDKVVPTLDQFSAGLEKANKDAAQWEQDLFTLIGKGVPMEVINQLVEMGTEGGPIVHKFATASGREFERMKNAMIENAKRGTKGYKTELMIGLAAAAIQARTGAKATVDEIQHELSAIPGIVDMSMEAIISGAAKWGIAVVITTQGVVSGAPLAPGQAPVSAPGGAPLPAPQTDAGRATAPAPVGGNPGQTVSTITSMIATQFGTPSASDYGQGRELSGTGSQPWAVYVIDPNWNVGYYDPGKPDAGVNPNGVALIWSSFGVYMGQYIKDPAGSGTNGVWVWRPANPGDSPPATAIGNETRPTGGAFAFGGVTDKRSTFAEAGREAAIPLWEGQPSRRTVGLLALTASELGYGLMPRSGRRVQGHDGAAAPTTVKVVQVPVQESWVSPVSVDVHGVDPEQAMRWGQRKARTRAAIRPGRGNG